MAQSDVSRSSGAWQPLQNSTFRKLLTANLISDIGTFMQTVGAAWLMTSLTKSPLYIALIQTASALPFFLLALPAGRLHPSGVLHFLTSVTLFFATYPSLLVNNCAIALP
jgi:hypothetical protein